MLTHSPFSYARLFPTSSFRYSASLGHSSSRFFQCASFPFSFAVVVPSLSRTAGRGYGQVEIHGTVRGNLDRTSTGYIVVHARGNAGTCYQLSTPRHLNSNNSSKRFARASASSSGLRLVAANHLRFEERDNCQPSNLTAPRTRTAEETFCDWKRYYYMNRLYFLLITSRKLRSHQTPGLGNFHAILRNRFRAVPRNF